MSQGNDLNVRIADAVQKRQAILEKVFCLLAVAGLLMKVLNVKFYGITLVVSMMSLSTIYFIMAFRTSIATSSAMEVFINKISSYGNSIAIVGLLFTIQNWEGSLKMMMVGILTLLIVTCIGFFKGLHFDNRNRSLVILLICTLLYILPAEMLHELNIIHTMPQVSGATQ